MQHQGTAEVFVTVLTDWPELSGMDLMDGESIATSVQVNGIDDNGSWRL